MKIKKNFLFLKAGHLITNLSIIIQNKKIRKLFDESIRIFQLLQLISSKLLFFAHFVFTSFEKYSYDQRFKITSQEYFWYIVRNHLNVLLDIKWWYIFAKTDFIAEWLYEYKRNILFLVKQNFLAFFAEYMPNS